MRFSSIASGSSGNCIYVGSDTTHILIDAGISAKRTVEGLAGLDIKPEELDAILITHEHADHVQGLGVLSRKYSIPIYATKGTICGIKSASSLGKIDDALFNEVKKDVKVSIKDLVINPMEISHDANEPVAYRVSCEKKKVSVITDLGTFNEYTIDCIKDSDIIMAEANHDIRMLQVGPYPYYLKQRILSDRGHLSNENSGRLLSGILHDNLKAIFLGHLSKENNLPELAYETVRLEIEASDNKYHGNDFPLYVAKRDCPMTAIEF
ncbi:MAG: MBL fold metallo-hydrolase [Lachnospiraceae bacterium]|nr:MBL fold metallo-hydrolase [Lachnospiraceae bacterium]MCR4934488.1 MBL fold metallo-hydrolase [Lachnospiraceae bacterium]